MGSGVHLNLSQQIWQLFGIDPGVIGLSCRLQNIAWADIAGRVALCTDFLDFIGRLGIVRWRRERDSHWAVTNGK